MKFFATLNTQSDFAVVSKYRLPDTKSSDFIVTLFDDLSESDIHSDFTLECHHETAIISHESVVTMRRMNGITFWCFCNHCEHVKNFDFKLPPHRLDVLQGLYYLIQFTLFTSFSFEYSRLTLLPFSSCCLIFGRQCILFWNSRVYEHNTSMFNTQ